MAGRDLRGGIFRDGLGAAKQGGKSGRRTPRRGRWLLAQPRPGARARQEHTFYTAAIEEGGSQPEIRFKNRGGTAFVSQTPLAERKKS